MCTSIASSPMRALPLSGLAASLCLATACSKTEPQPIPTPADTGVRTSSDAGSVADVGSIEPDAGSAIEDSGQQVSSDAGSERYTWWQDVEPIVRNKCLTCHAAPPLFGAPMSLVRYADTQVNAPAGGLMHELMAFRVGAPQNRMPPPSQPQLSPEEIHVIQVWSQIGAPEGTPPVMTEDGGVVVTEDAGVVPGADAGTPTYNQWTMDLVAHAPNDVAQPYDVPLGQTNYQCWSITVPAGAPRGAVVRIENIIVNSQHLHHTLVFKNRNHDAEPGPFDCSGLPLTWDMIGGWAPGRMDEIMPPGVGVSANPGDQFVVQAHYDSVTQAGETDASGVRLVLTDEPGLLESGVVWAGLAWGTALNGPNATRTWTCTVRRAFTMYEVFPHMHQTGTRITLELQRSGQPGWDMVSEVPVWSFHDQPNVHVPLPLQQVQPGDKLKTTCWWDTQGRGINFGEASQDEMCFNFINHYPLIPNANLACVGYAP